MWRSALLAVLLLVAFPSVALASHEGTPPGTVLISHEQWEEVRFALGVLVFFSALSTVQAWRSRG